MYFRGNCYLASPASSFEGKCLSLSMSIDSVYYPSSLAKNVYACAATKITWSISGKVIGLEPRFPRNIVKMKKEMAAFFVSGSVVVFLPL